MLTYPHPIRKGVNVRLRARGLKDDLEVHSFGSLGRLGEKNVNEIRVNIIIDKEHSADIVNVRAVCITQNRTGKKEIAYVPADKREEDKSSFLFCLPVIRDGDNYRVGLQETPALVIMEKSGKVTLQYMLVVAQKNEFFFVALRTFEVQIYRNENNKLRVPQVTGEHLAFPDLERFLLNELYYQVPENRNALPLLANYQEKTTEDLASLKPDEFVITWVSARRQISGGFNAKGETVRVPWFRLPDKEKQQDWKPGDTRPRVKYIPVGAVLKATKFVAPNDTRSHIDLEAFEGVAFSE